ncbi:hypothetical protein EHI92_11520 [Cronobacter sakazakii]|nr:hypothetical protein [Cronobacter sakazakii]
MSYFFSGKRIASPVAENFLPEVFGFVVEFSIALQRKLQLFMLFWCEVQAGAMRGIYRCDEYD